MKERKVTRCTGEGQGSCSGCNMKGIWNRSWMCFRYKIEGIQGVYCAKCAKEILGVETLEVDK